MSKLHQFGPITTETVDATGKYRKADRVARESDIEAYLVKRVKELGGEARKVKWVGRDGAPDRVVMIPAQFLARYPTIWVELKNPETIKTFPANPHERAQHREHERMRRMGQRVVVVGTMEGVEELLS